MMKKTRENKGITLIALVITIIVLLILAGVAIAMLSGENGILKKAAEAKTKTEEAKQQEETTLTDYEIDSNFILKHSNFKCRYGMITGITVQGKDITDTVEKLQAALPDGYTIVGDGITNSTNLRTGLEIQKNGNTVAWTVVYGDLDGISSIDSGDATVIINALDDRQNLNECYKVAADVDKDGDITTLDSKMISDFGLEKAEINQYEYSTNPKTISLNTTTELEVKYRKMLNEKIKGSKYSIENMDYYGESIPGLKGADSQTKVGDILTVFGDSNISIMNSDYKARGDDELIQNEDSIIYKHTDGREINICYIFNI